MVEGSEVNTPVAATEAPATKTVIDAGGEPRKMPAGGLPASTTTIIDSRNGQAAPHVSTLGRTINGSHGDANRTVIDAGGEPRKMPAGGLPPPTTISVIDSRTGQAVPHDSTTSRTIPSTGHYSGATHGAPTRTIINGEPAVHGHAITGIGHHIGAGGEPRKMPAGGLPASTTISVIDSRTGQAVPQGSSTGSSIPSTGHYSGGRVSGGSIPTMINGAPYQHGSLGHLPPQMPHGASPIPHRPSGHLPPQMIPGGMSPRSHVSGASFGSYPGATSSFHHGPSSYPGPLPMNAGYRHSGSLPPISSSGGARYSPY